MSIPHTPEIISLDREYNINRNDWIVILKPNSDLIITKPKGVIHKSIAAYGISGQTTEVTLLSGGDSWTTGEGSLSTIRETLIYCEPEELELAEEPIDTPIGKQEDEKTDDRIELDGFYEDLESGRWVIVSGEREITGTSGVRSSELAMLSSVTQDIKQIDGQDGPDEKIHTFIKLAEPLAYKFKRDTVKIHGNVVKATHGETRREVLGSGNGSKALQSFALKQKPLTHVAASNPTGVDSTLKVFVNDIQWHEEETLADRQPTDRNFITKTDNENITSIAFGNGKKGARLPTGLENIKAEYRSGIGKAGNVRAEQISLLMDRPLGAKAVINPLRASGGADREGRDQARKNAPLAVRALDRLVSVQDYEDFSRTYAGIGKARAAELSNGRQQLVHITIAGADDIPIDETSDLFQNLRHALHEFGDPYQPIRLAVRELMLMVVSANIKILPDYQWEPVVTKVRRAMLDAFSFERRELGQDVLLSEVFSVMQSVRGVAYVDIDFFGGIPEKIKGDSKGADRRLLTPDEITSAIEYLSMQIKDEQTGKLRLLTSDEIAEAVWCKSIKGNEECCNKYNSGKTDTAAVRQRLEVNLADFENGSIRPAQLAFLTPDVPETLILNQIK